MTKTYETVLFDVKDNVATITLNRPDVFNAFGPLMMRDLMDVFDIVDRDDDVRAVIITGAGKHFCAGADLSHGTKTFNFAERTDAEYKGGVHRDRGGQITLRIFECLKPVIGAINGAAVGFGATVILPMDFRLASTAARFGYVFTRRGINIESAASWFLPRIVSLPTALDWNLTGRIFNADEALKAGLVRSLHAPEELLPAAHAIAREIVENTAPVSVALTRQLLWRMSSADHPIEAHKFDSRGVQERGKSADAKEGVGSFLEKRKPNFTDKVSKDMPDFFPWWKDRPFE